MKYVHYLLFIGFLASRSVVNIDAAAIPAHKAPEQHQQEEAPPEDTGEDWEKNLEYGRYLKEIVQVLESDTEFRKKLETANVDEIKSGKIARELHFVDHGVRTKLDELKRQELERLRHLAIQEHEKQNGIDRTKLKMPVHIDLRSPNRFEVEDLRKLIVQTTKDLEEADRQRREEFKNYEMQKEFEFNQSLQGVDETHRQELLKQHEEEKKKHSEHEKLLHPGSKQQLEGVWEEQDHLDRKDFDPNVFFHLHDRDNNGYWDEIEVKSLFKQELDKMYDPNNPEDDINEKYEEMERMREHVFKEVDLNSDGLISHSEFMEQARKSEFEQNDGWQGLDEQKVFSEQEYAEYERLRQAEIDKLIQEGKIAPPPYYHGPPPPHPAMNQAVPPIAIPHQGGHPQGYQAVPQGYQAAPQGYQQAVPQGYQAIPQGYQAVPQGYQQAVPQGYQQAVPQGYQAVPQGYQQAVPQNIPAGQKPIPQQAIPHNAINIPSNSIADKPIQAKIDPAAQVNPNPAPIAGQPVGGNQGIPQAAVPQVSQHLDAAPPVQQQQQQHVPQQQQQPPLQQQQQQVPQHQQQPNIQQQNIPHVQQGAPPNVVGQNPPQVINNVPGTH